MKYKTILLSALLPAAFCLAQTAVSVKPQSDTLVRSPGKCAFQILTFSGAETKIPMEVNIQLNGMQQNQFKQEQTKPLPANHEAIATIMAEFDIPAPGLYELTATLAPSGDSAGPVSHASTYCLVTPEAAQVPDIGVQTHFGKWGHVIPLMDAMKHIGISRFRDEIYWNVIEKKPGVFEFPPHFASIYESARQHSLVPLVIMDYGNPVAYPELFPKNRSFPSSPEARALFLKYVETLVSRFGDGIKAWELWNEPNNVKPAVYLELLKEVYAKIHFLQPEATVISCGGGGAGGGPSAAYISPIVAKGGVDFQDAFSVHPYMAPADPDRGYGPCKGSPLKFVNVPDAWGFLDKFCKAHPRSDGRLLRFWVSEIGWPTGGGRNACGELDQAAYIARTLIQHRKSNTAEALFIYDLLSDGPRQGNAEHNFGLLNANLSPKPSFAAMAAFLRLVGSRKCTETITDESNFKVFRFEDTIVAYAVEKNKPYELKGIQKAEVYQWDGYQNGNSPKNGTIELKLTKMPLYVKVKE